MPSFSFADTLLRRLAQAKRVSVLTGAGVSAESGVPTFRDAQTGQWSTFRPEELATPEGFRKNPRLVWEWYASRRARLDEVEPNPGHRALAELERRVPDFLLATQNVDGLHQRAGSRRVVELHGNIRRTKCFRENTSVDAWADDGQVPPRCPRCGGPLRPDVVWFNEMLPADAFEQALVAVGNCEIYFCVGTSGLVYPAADLPREARKAGALLVEVNPNPTPLTPEADHFLPGPSGVILPELMRATWSV